MKICMIPVCYNAHDDALRLLDSVDRALKIYSGFTLDVILADNSTIPSNIDISSRRYGYAIHWLKNNNVGYFPAFNNALARLQVESYDFVIVCNVDLVIAENFFLILAKHPLARETGLIAPSILSEKNGRDLNPKIIHRPSARKMKFMRMICSSATLFTWYQKLASIREQSRARSQKRRYLSFSSAERIQNKPMYGAHGSFMVFTRHYFAMGAHVFYPRFLFGEEVFVAEQLRIHGLKIEHVPGLRVFDKEHASTSQIRLDFIRAEHKKSYEYLYGQFYAK
ncbi:glycosyltransferase family 2 protein [Aromatoleum buckelii]|uniref:Glycosyltransferase n=1 Tax=Aromatoleum buckelii TaxID=200254 RepID=A0ABX1N5M2_9RHOO|nr:glycosyltransferase [Aromatoleum buckelii]MCK0512714.1 glycosyltransferase [Aromatoleum buckelii]